MPLHELQINQCFFYETQTSHIRRALPSCSILPGICTPHPPSPFVTLTCYDCEATVARWWKLLLDWQRACSGALHTLPDYPLFSCQTHSPQLQKAGQSGTQVRCHHFPGDMWPSIFALFICPSKSFSDCKRNVILYLFFFSVCIFVYWFNPLSYSDIHLQDSKMLGF